MGIKSAVALRPPEWECGFTHSVMQNSAVEGVWIAALDISDKRGTMYVRHQSWGNSKVELRITIDGIANIIRDLVWRHASMWWIFDFNESVKVEHRSLYGATASRVELAYYFTDPTGHIP